MELEADSPQFREVQERRRKSALYTSVGSRKNLLELAGTTKNILNTPQKPTPAETTLSILIDPSKLQKEFDKSTLRPFENSHSLSPSAKYDTPTPPLKSNQFVRNAYRPRRKFSMLREKFEDNEPSYETTKVRQEKVNKFTLTDTYSILILFRGAGMYLILFRTRQSTVLITSALTRLSV